MKTRRSIFSFINLITWFISDVTVCVLYYLLAMQAIDAVKQPYNIPEISLVQKIELQNFLDSKYPERTALISELPYEKIPVDFSTSTSSIMMIDANTGSIIYEKNSDKEIPPASMTKLVEMYVVFEAIENGEVSFDDVVNLPPESWHRNLPSDASKMFLAQGQTVTLNELLLGLAIASGNDASIAVANHVCGNMEDFVARMNKVVSDLGLQKTHFVESSGYSEYNITTAREFAAFCRVYLERFPWTLEKYHSQAKLAYPLEKNLPNHEKYKGDTSAIIQYNTNKLLDKLPGCDGLKTGYIDESGYNLSLTAQRYGNRFIAVMMKGPGRGSAEGNKYRIADGTAIMEYAFANYADYNPSTETHYAVPVLGGNIDGLYLVPALDERFTVPFIASDSPTGAAASVQVRAEFPDYIDGSIQMGTECGTLYYYLNDQCLRSVPLVADQSVEEGSTWKKFIAVLAKQILHVHSLM